MATFAFRVLVLLLITGPLFQAYIAEANKTSKATSMSTKGTPKPSDFPWIPVVIVIAVVVAMAVIGLTVYLCARRQQKRDKTTETTKPSPSVLQTTAFEMSGTTADVPALAGDHLWTQDTKFVATTPDTKVKSPTMLTRMKTTKTGRSPPKSPKTITKSAVKSVRTSARATDSPKASKSLASKSAAAPSPS